MHLSCVLVCGALSRKILLDFSAVSCVLVLKLVREHVLHFCPPPPNPSHRCLIPSSFDSPLLC